MEDQSNSGKLMIFLFVLGLMGFIGFRTFSIAIVGIFLNFMLDISYDSIAYKTRNTY